MSVETWTLIIASFGLIITILGWVATYNYQSKILERQLQAEKDMKSLELTHQLALGIRQLKLDVLPLAREKMLETHAQIAYLGRRIIEYPDFSSWSEDKLTEWVKTLEFTSFQKAELMMAKDKAKYYVETQFWYDARKGQKSLDDFHNYLIFKKPFIDSELFAEFSAIEYLFSQSLSGITSGRRSHDYSIESHFVEALAENASPTIEKIEQMIKNQINQNFPVTI